MKQNGCRRRGLTALSGTVALAAGVLMGTAPWIPAQAAGDGAMAQPPWSQTPAWLHSASSGSSAPQDSTRQTTTTGGASAVSPVHIIPMDGAPTAAATAHAATGGVPPAIAPYDMALPQYGIPPERAQQAATLAPVTTSTDQWAPQPSTAMPYGQATGAGVGAGAGAGPSNTPPAQPLWEVGVIAGAAYLPDYPAADQSSAHYLPFPILVYRGEVLRAGDKGLVRGRLIHTRDLELDVSLNGSFPTSSDDNTARKGMPDLDWMAEIGPRVQWTVARAARDAKIDVELPLRAVLSTDFHSDLSYRGLVFAPELAYQNARFLTQQTGVDLALKVGLSPIFATEELQDTFYEVESAYATASRATYDAEAGYMGSKFQVSAAAPITPWVGLMAMGQANFHQGAANEDSPLFKDDMTFGVGLALSITLAKSRTAAPQ